MHLSQESVTALRVALVKKFYLIMSHGILHFVEKDTWKEIL